MTEHQYSRLNSSEDDLLYIAYTEITSEKDFHAVAPRGASLVIISLPILSNLTFAALWIRNQQLDKNADCLRPLLTNSTARKAIMYERRRLSRDISPKNNFAGLPRPELDATWRRLVEPITIKVTPEEIDLADLRDPTIAFKDGSWYIAEVAVYHELHCVKRTRRAFHMDYYYPNMSNSERALEHAHIDHSLECWREAAMCRGDINLANFSSGVKMDPQVMSGQIMNV